LATDIIISAKEIDKSYITKSSDKAILSQQVLKKLSLELYRGELLAIMGPSGVGKSTLLYILGSLDKPDSGNIELYIDGINYNYSAMNDDALSRFRNKEIGFVFQFHHLLPEFTALENVMIPAMIKGSSYKEASIEAENLLVEVKVEIVRYKKPTELSGGEQQRVAIARALINQPKIIFADEPTGNLDAKNAENVLNILLNLQQKYSITFIITTHSQDVASIAERRLQMLDGRII
jgi:lipoprotein-releasing system ATP-binding protein